jgi:hypothetical protein
MNEFYEPAKNDDLDLIDKNIQPHYLRELFVRVHNEVNYDRFRQQHEAGVEETPVETLTAEQVSDEFDRNIIDAPCAFGCDDDDAEATPVVDKRSSVAERSTSPESTNLSIRTIKDDMGNDVWRFQG